jgi:hypothetical protein
VPGIAQFVERTHVRARYPYRCAVVAAIHEKPHWGMFTGGSDGRFLQANVDVSRSGPPIHYPGVGNGEIRQDGKLGSVAGDEGKAALLRGI